MYTKVKYLLGGEIVTPGNTSCDFKFPQSVTKPDESLDIRQIYERWQKGKPTTIHPFNLDFDDEDDDPEYVDRPIDPSEIEELNSSKKDAYEQELERVKTARKVRENASKGEEVKQENNPS